MAAQPGARVLVVEDDDVTQAILRDMLEREGCKVDVAHNGLDALDAWQRRNQTSSCSTS